MDSSSATDQAPRVPSRAEIQALRDRLPAFPSIPALLYATVLDPDRVTRSRATPYKLRRPGSLDSAALGAGSESRPRPHDVAIARRRITAAIDNAAAATTMAAGHAAAGDTNNARSCEAVASALLAAAAALTCWIDWLERESVTSDNHPDADPAASWPLVATHRPAWHPPPGMTGIARGPLAPRAPATAAERTAA